jgi:hypothetical protein
MCLEPPNQILYRTRYPIRDLANSPQRPLKVNSDIHLNPVNTYLLSDIRITPRIRQRLIHRPLSHNHNVQRTNNQIAYVARV